MSTDAPAISLDGDVEMGNSSDANGALDAVPAPSSDAPPTPTQSASTAIAVVADHRPIDVSHAGLKRSIALVLDHVGFDGADTEAVASFALAVEEYIDSILGVLKRQALSARREQPTPVDFERTLQTFNLPIDSLKPHVRHPIHATRLVPKVETISLPDGPHLRPLPTLADELSGKPAKEEKEYIPSLFPEFPSRHTFISTPREESQDKKEPNTMREHLSKAAKQGEDALRGLLRASKVRQQKEVRSQAQRYPASRERYKLWEQAMGKMMKPLDEEGLVRVEDSSKPAADQVANASMIVNFSTDSLRREGVRTTRRPPARTTFAADHVPR
ncbi:unnamed protein product [Parascedosporium putredinis]|uniref:Transcription initiation factor TFIID subunit 8 n=1 Tax=Parascedosporium putredinis TaxID=1442378 RepID=A0A9P1MBR3_9PEZI|nr:unnamed protein product [Parascedosporium putredinis]CAI7995287.1 unnamed protein product [Parascedosporium putredinis]